MLVNAPTTNEGCDPVSNLAMSHPNFVLQVDLPRNYGGADFHGFIGGGPWHSFSVSEHGSSLQWNFGSNEGKQQSGNLIETSSPAIVTQAMIIKKGSEAAFYLNEAPLAYIDDPILDAPIYGVMLNCGQFDNVKFWNLDKFPDLP